MATTGSAHLMTVRRVGGDPHGQLLAMAATHDPALADSLHEGQHVTRPYALAPDGETLRLVAFDQDLARGLALGAARLGTLVAIGAPVYPATLGGDGGVTLTVRTRTPVQFRAGRDHGMSTGSRRDALFPDPARIVGDALAKWRALDWPELSDPNTNRIGGHLDAYQVQTYRAGQHVWRGWCGTVVLDLRPLSVRDRTTAWTLMRFAALRGLGSHTTYGMGAVEIEGTPRAWGLGSPPTAGPA